ncbi:MAG TPA: hypothetical protein DHW82_07800 [Spirochaetia bacterium]|nr:hypothetical protein [Spirochaetia bacterium]
MKPIVIVGAVAAGMSAASQIKRSLPEREVIVFGKEKYISYGACGMPFYISGEIKDFNRLIVLKPEKAVTERKINLKIEHEVLSIDRKNKKVKVKNLQDGSSFEQEYEKLVLATGSRAIIPPLPGIELRGIFPLKELDDSIQINSFIDAEKPKKAVIIGGGFIGVEAAESFRKRNMEVTLIEAAPRILAILDEDFSTLVQEEMIRNEVKVLTNQKAVRFEGERKVKKVILENGEVIEADLVLLSIGVLPNSKIAEEAGLSLGDRKAVFVNEFLQTSDPDIFAGGDCATVYHTLFKKDLYIPLALGANRQGRMCGENITASLSEKPLKKFPGIIGSSMTKVFDFEIGKTGIGQVDIERNGISDMDSVSIKYVAKAGYYPERSKIWVKLYFEKDSQIIKGGQIVGQNGSVLRLDVITVAISQEMTLEEFYNLDLGYCPPFSPVWDPLLVAARAGMKEE